MFLLSVSNSDLCSPRDVAVSLEADFNEQFSLLKTTPESSCVSGHLTVCGYARLTRTDDSPELPLQGLEALRYIAAEYQRGGVQAVSRLHGEFGIALWDELSRTLAVVRDPIGLVPIYFSLSRRSLYVADTADCFPDRNKIDIDCVALFLSSGGTCLDKTIWSGVVPLPAGEWLIWQNGKLQHERYWSAETHQQRAQISRDQAVDEFRALFRRAVLQSVEPDGRTWADLSGGLDSSSIVASASTFGRDVGRALGGTITYVESLGGDETRFVDAVLKQCQLRNERLHDTWPWQDDGAPPPVTSEPSRDYPFYARDRQTAAILKAAGATTLLSGVGPDIYMPHGAYHAVDLLRSGSFSDSANQLFRWAYIRGQSIWTVIARDVLLASLPTSLQAWFARRRRPAPRWLRPGFVKRHGFNDHWCESQVVPGRVGAKGQMAIANQLSRVVSHLRNWRSLNGILRQPYLSRSLVEFCLSLPHAVRTDVAHSKPLLRGAVEGILPIEILRRQCTKGTALGPRICWSFRRERSTLRQLLREPVLADLGCIEPKEVLRQLDDFASGRGDVPRPLYEALSLETWLAVRVKQYAPRV